MNDIQALLAMMEDADRDIRARGAEKSGQLGKDAPEAIAEKLLQLLNDGEEDEEVQGAAFEAAEAIGISLFDDELESMTRAIMSKAINRHLGDEEMERYCAHEVGETEGLVLEKHLDRC
ncbi:MAG: hypothetical protein HN368_06600, partial [Spirochaetales bacterium]|nr:hypothetical protein [Spirochaetales bacterium]